MRTVQLHLRHNHQYLRGSERLAVTGVSHPSALSGLYWGFDSMHAELLRYTLRGHCLRVAGRTLNSTM
jgi:hypothetical protein